MSQASNLKLSFWSVFVPDAALMRPAASDGGDIKERPQLFNAAAGSGMYKEIFGWRMQEDLFGGVADADDRERLNAALFETLAVQNSPQERSISVLFDFVKVAEDILAKGKVEWSNSQSVLFDDDEEGRINALLALVCHLRWLIAVFNEQPNISVTAR